MDRQEIIEKINDRLVGLLILDDNIELTTSDVFKTFTNEELEIYKQESSRINDYDTVNILDNIISMKD